MPKPPALGSPRFFRLVWMTLREANLGGRLLCKVGLHKWETKTEKLDGFGAIRLKDTATCTRPFCPYHGREFLVNDELRRIH